MTIHQLLHFRIEILHADRDTRESRTSQHCQLVSSCVARMDFDGRLKMVVVEARSRQDGRKYARKIVSREKCRRATTQMNANQRALFQPRHAVGVEVPFGGK